MAKHTRTAQQAVASETPEEDKLYTFNHAAERADVCRTSIYNFIKQGRLEVVYLQGNMPRVTGKSLNALIRGE